MLPSSRGKRRVVEEPMMTTVRMSTCAGDKAPSGTIRMLSPGRPRSCPGARPNRALHGLCAAKALTAAADKADRKADDQRRLGSTAPKHFEQMEEGGWRISDNRYGVGEVGAPQLYGGGRTRRREPAGDFGHRRIVKHAGNGIVRRQPCARNAGRDHPAVAQDRRTRLQSPAPRLAGMLRKGEIGDDVDHAACMGDPDGNRLKVGGEAAEIGFPSDDGDGAPIDFTAIPDVSPHFHLSACRPVDRIRARSGVQRLSYTTRSAVSPRSLWAPGVTSRRPCGGPMEDGWRPCDG